MKEAETLLIILNKNIIPRAFSFMRQMTPKNSTSDPIIRRVKHFENIFEKFLTEVEGLEKRIKN